ncbi:MAG: hypothetical protein OEU32_05285 [Acidimicrobiia bacterium]|nr:hypothetical protein [Acidimicrobiia bacterium]
MEATSLRFAAAARDLGEVARAGGLELPAFRSPPRRQGLRRSIRRAAGGVTVSVVLRERPWLAVMADMVDGIIAANELAAPEADEWRDRLWAALDNTGEADGTIAAAA